MASQATSTPFAGLAAAEQERSRYRALLLHGIIFLVAFGVLVLRRPDAIFNAQFYAEDGKYWYADAYNHGWACVFMPQWGYLQTVSRLVALLSLLVPLAHAPLVMNLCAMVFQILPVNLFLSSRFDAIPFRTRLLGSFLYLALPNSMEIHANTTNIQWHLALAACLVLFARPGTGMVSLLLDTLLMTLSILDGALGMLLMGVLAALCWQRKDVRFRRLLVWLLPVTALQVLVVVFSGSRPPGTLGVTIARCNGILGGQLFLSSVLGQSTLGQLYSAHALSLVVMEAAATLIGLLVVLYALRYGPLELRLFNLFAYAVLALSLIRPFTMMEGLREEWDIMQLPGIANRYYFLPMTAFLASLFWMLHEAKPALRAARYAASAIVLLLPVGICRDWFYPPYPETHFREIAAQFERAAPGTKIAIPQNPTDWRMELVKK
jgi:hypothetical protein